ncbi:MAG: ATP-binding protein [Actinomycetota bacterium]|nr:ATP-binding protein [Actinomycetota bacterium]
MSPEAAQLRFAVEFATFLVAVAGATIVLLRPQLVGSSPRSRFVLALGFLCVAAAAFLHGSLLTGAKEAPVIVLRGTGIVLLAVGTLGWGDDRTTRRSLWVALVLMAGAEAAAVSNATIAADWLRGASAVALGTVLITSGRRSVPARIAVSAVASLLVVVLSVSVALSIVIAGNVEQEASRRVSTRALVEADAVQSTSARDAINSAKLVALTLQGRPADFLLGLSRRPRSDTSVADDLGNFVNGGLLAATGPLLYATDQRRAIAGVGLDQAGVDALVGSRAVNEIIDKRSPSTGSVEVIGGRVLAVGAHEVTVPAPQGRQLVGIVIASAVLDNTYLSVRAESDPGVTLSLVDRDQRLASVGRQLPEEPVLRVAREALGESGRSNRVSGGNFLAGRAVLAPDGTRVLAVVASLPTTTVDQTRNSLFRSLFLVGLLTALVAFFVAVFVGERIGVGLRKLTVAAEAIQAGDLSVRTDVASGDEVGVLGATFDSMAESIESLAAELRQTADEEAQVRARMEAVVAGMGEALMAVDAAGRITTFNAAAEELFGISSRYAVGQSAASVATIVAEDGTDLSARLATPSATPWSAAAVVVREQDVRIPVALSAGGLGRAGGAVGGGVYVLRDMRREREAERAKSELLSNISHELRTPLVPIKGYAELLLKRKVPVAKARESLEEIVEAADRLEVVVQRLLDVAAQETMPLNVRKEPVPVRPLLESVVDRWKGRVDASHPISRRLSRDLPSLSGDRRLLERCLEELVDNAVKFSPAGGPVWVTANLAANGSSTAAGHAAVEISVRDQGIGIPEDRLDGIFEDFAQGDSSPTRQFGGLGLGLALVRRVVAAHEGELVCETTLGEGSTFTIVLPAAVPPPATSTPATSTPATSTPGGSAR